VGRIYYVSGSTTASPGTALTTYYDLVDISHATKAFCLRELVITQSTEWGDSQSEQILVQIIRAAAGYTSGVPSGTPVPGKSNTSDPSSGLLVNTDLLTTFSGSSTVLRSFTFNVFNELAWRPRPEERPWFAATEGLIVRLGGPIADIISFSRKLTLEEMG